MNAIAEASGDLPRPRTLLGWGLISVLLLFQWALFRQHVEREVAWFVPRHHDQAEYLLTSYQIHETLLSRGLLRGLGMVVQLPSANGLFLPLHGALLYFLLGVGRLSALTLNFLWFAGFQVALAGTLFWRTRRWSVALLGVGLLLTAGTPLRDVGGLTDFRIDFVAFCLYGIFLCTVVRSRVFYSRRWSLAAGCAAATLALYRYIASVYLAGALGLFWIYLVVAAWRTRDAARRRALLRRFAGTTLCGLVVVATVAPFLFLNRQALWNYYVANHILGEERHIRAAECGVFSTAGSFLFYPASVWSDHAGPLFLFVAALGLVVALLLRRERPADDRSPNSSTEDTRLAWVFTGLCLLVPYAVLTMNVSKSPVVGSILVPSLVWLALLPLLRTAGTQTGPSRIAGPVLVTLAALALCCGVGCYTLWACHRGIASEGRPDTERVMRLHEEIIRRCREAGLRRVVLSTDTSHDFFPAHAVSVMALERHGLRLRVDQGLGNVLWATDEATALATLAESDFVILTSGRLSSHSVYPFDRSMRSLRARLREYCDQELVLLGEYPIFTDCARLYIRPQPGVWGDSGGYVTSRGLDLTSPVEFLRNRKAILLEGNINLRLLGKVPQVRVTAQVRGKVSQLSASLEVEGDRYRIRIPVDPGLLPEGSPVRFTLRFDSSFNPKALGVNEDDRDLVVFAPDLVTMLR
jgi:hypothetical protein